MIDFSKGQSGSLHIAIAIITLPTTAVLAYYVSRSANEGEQRNTPADDASKDLPYPPSPSTEHPIWGHGHLMPPIGGPAPDTQMLKWSKELGTVFSYRVPVFGRFVVMGDPDMARHVLVTNCFPKSFFMKYIGFMFGERSMISSAHKEPHHTRRRLFHKGFQPEFLSQHCLVIMKDRTLNFLEQCRQTNGETIAMLDLTQNYTSQIISSVAFGQDWSDFDHPARSAIRQMTETMMKLFDFRNSWNLVNPILWYRCWRQQQILAREMKSIVLEKFQRPTTDIISMATKELLHSTGKTEPDSEDIETIVDQLKTLYFAGHETTSNLISWVVWLLAQHDEVLQKLRTEIKTKLRGDWYGADGADYKSCTYLEAVLKETLRLYPPAAFARSGDGGPNVSQWNGYRLSGSTVICCLYVLHRSESNWGSTAEKFIPDRFLTNPNPKAFLPFSKGVYDCLGKSFAMLEAQVAIAALVSSFEFEAVDPDKEFVCSRLTLQPKFGCRVKMMPQRA